MIRLHSVRFRFVALIALVMTLVYGAIAYNQMLNTSARLKDELEEQTRLLVAVHADALADDLWNLNEAAIRRQLGLLITNQDILVAEVRETGGLLSIAASDGTIVSPDGGSAPEKSLISQPIRGADGTTIGELTTTVSQKRINAEQARLLQAQIQEFLILALVIVLAVALTVSNLVQPIIKITRTMTKLAGGELETPIPAIDRRDEIGDMARALEVFKANAKEVRGALEKQRELNGLQRQFVSMVSHEFRTPLGIIDGNAQRVTKRLETLSHERVTKAMKTIRNAVARLTGLMESVLGAAQLEEGRVRFEPADVDFEALLREVVDNYNELYSTHEITMRLQDVPPVVHADERLLRQMISNLVSNAVKYSPNAQEVNIEAFRDEGGDVCLSVRDHGVGIPKDELDRLFQRFFRASTSAGIAGSGIGLHLVHHFVELHGGSIGVESEVGAGTVFTLRLPCPKVDALAA